MKYKFLLAMALTCSFYAGDRTETEFSEDQRRANRGSASPAPERETNQARPNDLLKKLLEKQQHTPPKEKHGNYTPEKANRKNRHLKPNR